MSSGRALVISLLLAGIAPARAAAEWHVTPFVGAKFGGDTNLLLDVEDAAGETKLTFGGTVTLLGPGPLGVEADVALTPRFFQRGEGLVRKSGVTTVMGHVIVAAPERWTGYSLRPFVSGGVGLMHVSRTDVSEDTISANLWAFDIGGGAIGFLTERRGLRMEIRRFRSLSGSESFFTFDGERVRLSYWRGSIGVIFKF